jgi:SAM-dependent methyltransferase
MHESSKAIARRLHTAGFASHYFVGHGIDVGCGLDSLANYAALFPRIKSITDFDLPDGDAQYLAKHGDASFDFLHSSHCLEHMRDPRVALTNWLRVVKPSGYLIIMIPDEDLYEQGIWPSTFNNDHKHTFTLCKQQSWSPVSVNVTELIAALSTQAKLIKLELLHQTYLPTRERVDQTLNPVSECAIEIIFQRI